MIFTLVWPRKLLPHSTAQQQVVTVKGGGRGMGVYDGVSDRQPPAAKDKVFILLAAAFASLSFPSAR